MAPEIRERLSGERGLQKRVALRTGISEPTLSRYLSGKYVPSVDEALGIVRELGLDPSGLLDTEPGAEPEACRSARVRVEAAAKRLEATAAELRGLVRPPPVPGAGPPTHSLDEVSVAVFRARGIGEPSADQLRLVSDLLEEMLRGESEAESLSQWLLLHYGYEAKPAVSKIKGYARERARTKGERDGAGSLEAQPSLVRTEPKRTGSAGGSGARPPRRPSR